MITSIATTIPQAIHTKDGISTPPEKQAHRAIGIGLAAFEVLPHLIGEVAGTALGFGDWFIGGRSPRTSRASVGTAKKQGAVVLSVRSVASDASQWQ
jgi:hypothetical protein